MSLIDNIKHDRDAGTPGKWSSDAYGIKTGNDESYVAVCVSAGTRDVFEAVENARRIARVPDMEAALIAADDMAMWLEECIKQKFHAHPLSYLEEAIAAYRAATK